MRYIKVSIKIIAFLTALFVTLILIYNISFSIWKSGGKFVIKPENDILVTTLYNNPLPTPEQIEKIYIRQEEVVVCLRSYKSIIGGDNLFTRWFLNGERVPFERYHFFRYGVPDYCLGMYGVEPGLHLLEIHINSSPFYTAMSYQWAIKIEPTATPTSSTTPSAP